MAFFGVEPLSDYNAWLGDLALMDGVEREGGMWAAATLTEYGAEVGGDLMDLGRQADEHPPRLRAFDRYGNRLDEVEFHPAYHEIMRRAMEHGVHNLSWVVAAQGGIELSLPSISDEPTAEAEAEVTQEQALADAPLQPQTSASVAVGDVVAVESDSAIESVAVDSPAPAPAAEPVLAAGQGQVSVTFSADCWTQPTDANGKILFSGLKRGGESLNIVGKAPLELRLGFARGAQVSYNGQTVDVSPFITGETARLKLGL
jgi:hypothetical protein